MSIAGPHPDRISELPTCEVFVHGSGECDQLGLGEGVLERKKPTMVKYLSDKKIIQIVSGSLHNLALSANGTVYSWGCNDEGALGRSGDENVPLPVTALEGVPIRAIRVGDCHSAFIDFANRLWLCGSYKDSSGHLGFPDVSKGLTGLHTLHKAPTPVLMSAILPPKTRVEDVVCGANHTVILMSSTDSRRVSSKVRKSGGAAVISPSNSSVRSSVGSHISVGMKLMALGNDEFGQLGIGARESEEGMKEEDTVMLKHTSRGKRHTKNKLFPRDLLWNIRTGGGVCSIFATAQTTFLKTNDGSLFACGLNNFGQLGFGNTSVYPVRVLTRVEGSLLGDLKNVEFISGGTVHSAARTADGHVYTWGRRDYCGIEFGKNDVQPPMRVPKFEKISKISCGASHTLACDREGSVFAWGFGGTHQLGNLPRDISMGAAGSDEEPSDEQTPYKIDSKQLSERFVIGVAAGAQHSVEFAWNNQYAPVSHHEEFLELTKTPSRKRKSVTAVASPMAKKLHE